MQKLVTDLTSYNASEMRSVTFNFTGAKPGFVYEYDSDKRLVP